MPGPQGEFLEGENPFQSFDDRRNPQAAADERKAAALRFASLYQGAFSTGAGRQLLEFWSTMIRQRKIPPSASLGELAYANGVREFVEGIHAQIEFAKTGGGTPAPDDWFNT